MIYPHDILCSSRKNPCFQPPDFETDIVYWSVSSRPFLPCPKESDWRHWVEKISKECHDMNGCDGLGWVEFFSLDVLEGWKVLADHVSPDMFL